MSVGRPGPITRQDLEAKLRQVQGELQAAGDSARARGRMLGPVLAGLAIVLAFLFGRRKGKRQSTTVEIRRV